MNLLIMVFRTKIIRLKNFTQFVMWYRQKWDRSVISFCCQLIWEYLEASWWQENFIKKVRLSRMVQKRDFRSTSNVLRVDLLIVPIVCMRLGLNVFYLVNKWSMICQLLGVMSTVYCCNQWPIYSKKAFCWPDWWITINKNINSMIIFPNLCDEDV